MEWRMCPVQPHLNAQPHSGYYLSRHHLFLPTSNNLAKPNKQFQDLWIVIPPVRKLATGSPYFRSGEKNQQTVFIIIPRHKSPIHLFFIWETGISFVSSMDPLNNRETARRSRMLKEHYRTYRGVTTIILLSSIKTPSTTMSITKFTHAWEISFLAPTLHDLMNRGTTISDKRTSKSPPPIHT